MRCHGPFNQVVVQTVKESFDVQIYYPVKLKAAFARLSHRTQRRAMSSIAIGVAMEFWFHQRLQHHLHHHLRNAISHGGYTQRPLTAITFRYLDSRTGGGK